VSKHKAHHFLVSILIFLIISNLSAQQNDELLSIRYKYFPTSGLKDPDQSLNQNLKFEITQLDVKVAFPLFATGQQTAIFAQIGYRRIDFNYKGELTTSQIYKPDILESSDLNITFRQIFSNNWGMTFLINPGIASDRSSLQISYYTFQGGLLFNHYISRESRFSFGVIYVSNFGEPLPFPALELVLNSEKLRLNLFLPLQFEFWYSPLVGTNIGLSTKVEGNYYRIGASASISGESIRDGHFEFSAISAGPVFKQKLSNSFTLSIAGGVAFLRRFEVVNKRDDKLADLDIEPNYYIQAGIHSAL
jgi:hypothetical protein